MLIEYRLLIKDEEGEDDKVLIDGYSVYAPSFYAEYERLHWHINTGHHGSIDLRMASIPKAVLAVLEFEVHHLGDNLFDSLTCTIAIATHVHSTSIICMRVALYLVNLGQKRRSCRLINPVLILGGNLSLFFKDSGLTLKHILQNNIWRIVRGETMHMVQLMQRNMKRRCC